MIMNLAPNSSPGTTDIPEECLAGEILPTQTSWGRGGQGKSIPVSVLLSPVHACLCSWDLRKLSLCWADLSAVRGAEGAQSRPLVRLRAGRQKHSEGHVITW